jgi:hypothetical protein
VKDKFKQMGGKNHEKRNNDLTLVLSLKLLKYIQDYLSIDEEEEYRIFNYVYKFIENIEKKHKQLFVIKEDEGKIKIDDSVKEERNRLIIRNLLSKIINKDVIQKILYDGTEISWSAISAKVKTLSSDDCRNHWMTILRMFNLDKKCDIKKDLKMVNK